MHVCVNMLTHTKSQEVYLQVVTSLLPGTELMSIGLAAGAVLAEALPFSLISEYSSTLFCGAEFTGKVASL